MRHCARATRLNLAWGKGRELRINDSAQRWRLKRPRCQERAIPNPLSQTDRTIFPPDPISNELKRCRLALYLGNHRSDVIDESLSAITKLRHEAPPD